MNLTAALFGDDAPTFGPGPAGESMLTDRASVREAQTYLTQLGYYLGPTGIDGRWGPYTAAALKMFNDSRGSADGEYLTSGGLLALYVATDSQHPKGRPSGAASPAAAWIVVGLMIAAGVVVVLVTRRRTTRRLATA